MPLLRSLFTFGDSRRVRKCTVLFALFLMHAGLSHCRHVNRNNLPDNLSTPEECARVCKDGEKPRLCYYKFVVEYYTTQGAACDLAKGNRTKRNFVSLRGDECIISDGIEKSVFPINRMIPGPSIQTCKNDRIIVDLENKAEGLEITLHWHGLFQNGFQYYDGVPFLTQCPIHSENTFRYSFIAENSGTHFYHSHVLTHIIDGQYGSLIVRDAPNINPHAKLYDEDRPEHVILLSDLMHELSLERFPGRYRANTGQTAQNILINGKGNWKDPKTKISTNAPLETYTVHAGKRYRFRMINSFSTVCLAEFSIEGHTMSLIAQDGANVQPVKVNSIITAAGERADFIINANQDKRSYWIRVRGLGECREKGVQQLAILRYSGASEQPSTPMPAYSSPRTGRVYGPLDARECNGKPTPEKICVNQMKATAPDDPSLLAVNPDYRLVLNFDFYNFNNSFQKLFGSESEPFRQFFVAFDKTHLTSLVNDITFENPPGPPISQTTGYSKICGPNKLSQCTAPCTCSQVYSMPLNAVVEIITYDKEPLPDLQHPFHLHGYEFHVFSMGQFNRTITGDDIKQVLSEHTDRLQRHEYENVPGKDTVTVPQGGYVIVRFKANNPGWWLYHCHFSWHTATGMNAVLHVGTQNDLPPIPRGFPTCGDFTPPPPFWDSI